MHDVRETSICLLAQPGKHSSIALGLSILIGISLWSVSWSPYSFVAANNLYSGPSFLGYETGELGAKVTVTLQMFERR